jgi:hypothetical protein
LLGHFDSFVSFDFFLRAMDTGLESPFEVESFSWICST